MMAEIYHGQRMPQVATVRPLDTDFFLNCCILPISNHTMASTVVDKEDRGPSLERSVLQLRKPWCWMCETPT